MHRAHVILALLLTTASAAGGCRLEDMHPGESCGSCHDGDDAPVFGAGGTVYAARTAAAGEGLEGATVELTDAEGTTASLRSSRSGNFYTTRDLTPPLQVTITKGTARVVMAEAPSGDCNACHTPGSDRASGRIELR